MAVTIPERWVGSVWTRICPQRIERSRERCEGSHDRGPSAAHVPTQAPVFDQATGGERVTGTPLWEIDAKLTRRQREVAALVGRGATNREIGRMLGLSERTAQSYVSHILHRLGLRSRTELALWTAEHSQGD